MEPPDVTSRLGVLVVYRQLCRDALALNMYAVAGTDKARMYMGHTLNSA